MLLNAFVIKIYINLFKNICCKNRFVVLLLKDKNIILYIFVF